MTTGARRIDGSALARRLRAELAERAARLAAAGHRPGLAVLLVGDDPLEDLSLARRQAREEGVATGRLLVLGEIDARTLEHLLDQGDELGFLERLLDEVLGAFLHRRHGHGHVAVAGDEGHRQRRAALEQPILQLKAAHAFHADVGDEAGDLARVEAREERLGRIEAFDAVVLAFEQPLQRVTHGFVVVDDVDSAFLEDEAHSVTFVLTHCRVRLGRGSATQAVAAARVGRGEVWTGRVKVNLQPMGVSPL